VIITPLKREKKNIFCMELEYHDMIYKHIDINVQSRKRPYIRDPWRQA